MEKERRFEALNLIAWWSIPNLLPGLSEEIKKARPLHEMMAQGLI